MGDEYIVTIPDVAPTTVAPTTAAPTTAAPSYKHYPGACVSGSNIATPQSHPKYGVRVYKGVHKYYVYTMTTPEECATFCDNTAGCVAYEFFLGNDSGKQGGDVFDENDCMLQSANTVYAECGTMMGVDLYVKEESG